MADQVKKKNDQIVDQASFSQLAFAARLAIFLRCSGESSS